MAGGVVGEALTLIRNGSSIKDLLAAGGGLKQAQNTLGKGVRPFKLRLALMYLFPVASGLSSLSADEGSVPLIVAHRGASAQAPENTLPAFHLAWEKGADAIEGDFFLTRDGRIVCLHDPVTERSNGPKLDVANAALDELRALDVGSWKGEDYRGTPIPTFEEVLATVPEGKRFYIEIKCGPEILPVLEKSLETSTLDRDQFVIISFHPDVIREAKKRFPDIKACWLRGFSDDEKNGFRDPWPEIRATLRHTRADGFSCAHCRLVDSELIGKVRDLGLEFHVWTVNQVDDAKRLRDLGVDSITTDVPGVLLKALNGSAPDLTKE